MPLTWYWLIGMVSPFRTHIDQRDTKLVDAIWWVLMSTNGVFFYLKYLNVKWA